VFLAFLDDGVTLIFEESFLSFCTTRVFWIQFTRVFDRSPVRNSTTHFLSRVCRSGDKDARGESTTILCSMFDGKAFTYLV